MENVTDSGSIVLPVSALKSESTRVFAALAEGRTVHVSKHGEIVAAFRPIDDVPLGVAAAYAVPNVVTAELTARAMQRAVPTRAVSEAERGLPSLVTRDHAVYGVLTAASAPPNADADDTVPDLAKAAARSDAMRTFLREHPDASIDDIVAYRARLDGVDAEATTEAAVRVVDRPAAAVPPNAAAAADPAEVVADLDDWQRRGSEVEHTVISLLYPNPIAWARARHGRAAGERPANGDKRLVAAALRRAAGLAATDPVGARAVYVSALSTVGDSRPGVQWRLGDLARAEGHRAEAAAWYERALNGGEPASEPFTAAVADASGTLQEARYHDVRAASGSFAHVPAPAAAPPASWSAVDAVTMPGGVMPSARTADQRTQALRAAAQDAEDALQQRYDMLWDRYVELAAELRSLQQERAHGR